MTDPSRWMLRPAADADTDALYALMNIPQVYRWLLDGKAASRAMIERWLETARLQSQTSGFGMWLLLHDDRPAPAGCVQLVPYPQPQTAELIYALHPDYWGRGLATRMCWGVKQQALYHGDLERIIAGADQPNKASLAVMRRLGMRFLRNTQYPLGPGREYVFQRSDAPPDPLPPLLDIL